MDNPALARVFGEIADLLEIKGENPFKIRAYRNASETIATFGGRVADLDDARLRQIPGIGRDLAKKVREIVETGELPPGGGAEILDDEVRKRVATKCTTD